MGSPNLGTDPQTGQAENGIGQLWQGITGKSGPTSPHLPQGFEWMGPLSQNLAQGAASNVNYTGANAAMNAGTLGSGATAAMTAGTAPGALAGFNAGLGGLGQGLSTGFLPGMDQISAALQPGLDRQFTRGAADLREQGALTGNLSSSGLGQQMGDYRAGLDSALSGQVAGIYGNALNTGMNNQRDLTQTALNMPGVNNQTIYNPSAASGAQGLQNILGAIQTSMSGVSGAPFYANQGSSGNGAVGSVLGSMITKK